MQEQHAKTAPFLRSEHKPSCRGQVGHRVIGKLGDDGRERAAFQRLFHCPQCFDRARNLQDENAARRQAESVETGTVSMTGLRAGEILLDPQHRAAGPRAKRDRKTESGAERKWPRWRHFMQCAARETSAQRPVNGGNAKRHPCAGLQTRSPPFDIGHAAAQTRQGG